MSFSNSTKEMPGRASTMRTSRKPGNCWNSMLSIWLLVAGGRFCTNRILFGGSMPVDACSIIYTTSQCIADRIVVITTTGDIVHSKWLLQLRTQVRDACRLPLTADEGVCCAQQYNYITASWICHTLAGAAAAADAGAAPLFPPLARCCSANSDTAA